MAQAAQEREVQTKKTELKIVPNDSGEGEKAGILTIFKGKNRNAIPEVAPAQKVKTKEEEEEEKKKKERFQHESGLRKLFKNIFHTNLDKFEKNNPDSYKKATDFTLLVKTGFSGVTEEQFAKLVVVWDSEPTKVANRAISAVYKAARDKGIDREKLDAEVVRVRGEQKEASKLAQEAVAVKTVDLPETVTPIDRTPTNVVDLSEYKKLKTQEQMSAQIASALVHFSPEDPMRVRAEQMLAALDTNTLHNFTPEQLKTLLTEWIPSKQQELTEPQKELIQVAEATVLRIAKDNGLDADILKKEAVQDVMKQMHEEKQDGENDDPLNPQLRNWNNHDEANLEASETLDKGLYAKRDQQEIQERLDREMMEAVGTADETMVRQNKAAEYLGIQPEEMKNELKDAVHTAHTIGDEELGADGVNNAELGNYTLGQIKRKYEVLFKPVAEALGLNHIINQDIDSRSEDKKAAEKKVREKIQVLMDKGIVGRGDAGGVLINDPQELALLQEHRRRLAQQGMNPQEQEGLDALLASLPPEQREQMEQHLASMARVRGGDQRGVLRPPEARITDDPNNNLSPHDFYAQRREDILKSPENLDDGPSRADLRKKLLTDLEGEMHALSDNDTIRDFLTRRLQGVWNEQFALPYAQSLSKSIDVNEQGKKITVHKQEEFEEYSKLFAQRYQNLVDKVFEDEANTTLETKKNRVSETLSAVMDEIKKFQGEQEAANPSERSKQPRTMAEFAEFVMESNPLKWGSRKYLLDHEHWVINSDGTRSRVEVGENALFDENNKLVEGNIILWITDRIEHLNNENPDEQINFFSEIQIDLAGMWRPIQVGTLLRNRGFFTDQEGQDMPNLYNEVTNIVWLIGFIRNADVLIKKGFLEEDKVIGVLQQLFNTNTLAKGSLGDKSVMEWYFTHPAFFKENATSKELDTKMGDAIGESFLMYYNISDFKYMKENFGDLDFFMTGKGVQRALGSVIAGKEDLHFIDNLFKPENSDKLNRYLRQAKLQGILEMFDRDEHGNLMNFKDTESNRRHLTDFLNPFYPYKKNQKALAFSRKLVEQGAAERAGLLTLGEDAKRKHASNADNDLRAKWGVLQQGSSFAELTAYFMGYPLGAGTRGNTGVEAINTMEKFTRPYLYAKKLETIDRAGATGNRFTFGLLRGAFIDYVTGVEATSGESIAELLEKQHIVRKLETEARRTRNYDQKIEEALNIAILNDEEREEVRKEIAGKSMDEKFKIIRQNVAERMQFNRNDSQTHTTQWQNAYKLYDNVMHGLEVDYASFVQTTLYGYEFDGPKLQDKLKKDWITPSRYAFLTNKMPMNKMRRNLDDNQYYDKEKEYKFESRPLVEELFNRQVLKYAQAIWNEEMEHPYTPKLEKASKKWKHDWHKAQFLDPKTGYIKRMEGNPDKLDPIVDAMLADVEFNRVVHKAFLLCKFGGDLYSHTKWGTGAKHMRFGQREQAIHALASITAGIDDDDLDLTKNTVHNYFFTKHDIKLFRELSHNSFWKGFSKELTLEGGMGSIEGLFKGIGFMFKHIFN